MENHDIPLLFTFYFGDSAFSALRGASRRFKKWSCAFDHWISEYRHKYPQDTLKHALLAWRRLSRQSGKMPWLLTTADIDSHVIWLKQEGYANTTINTSLGYISAFYQWCSSHHVDSACTSDYNPAREISRLDRIPYTGAILWSRQELDAFFTLLQKDGSPLGRRDYAFFRARLALGVPLKHLQNLKWAQITQDGAGVWVSWRQDGLKVQLPDSLWQVVMDYLSISGRLAGMNPEKYIFAPQVQPVFPGSGCRAEHWLEYRPISRSALLSSLKLYGTQLAIPASRLTLLALQRTAIRLRLDQDENLEALQIFMDTREKLKSTRYRLRRLPDLPPSSINSGSTPATEAVAPRRTTLPLEGDEGLTHGFYARRRDLQAVSAIMAENIQGMNQEIACLRHLMRLLLEWEGDVARQLESYSQAAHRLGVLVSAGGSARKEKDTWVEEMLAMLDGLAADQGRLPVSPQIRQEALGVSSVDPSGFVTEEIATLRLLLRNIYSEAIQQPEVPTLPHLVNLYGLSCIQLVKLIKLDGGDENELLKRYINTAIDEAIRQVNEELRIKKEG